MQIADTKKKIKKNTKAALNEIKKKACSLALAGCITLSQNGYGNYIHDYRQYFEHKRKPTKKKNETDQYTQSFLLPRPVRALAGFWNFQFTNSQQNRGKNEKLRALPRFSSTSVHSR